MNPVLFNHTQCSPASRHHNWKVERLDKQDRPSLIFCPHCNQEVKGVRRCVPLMDEQKRLQALNS